MLVTMLTALYMMMRVSEQLGMRWIRQPEPLPYLVSQPLPWQVHNVSYSRKGSQSLEFEGMRRNSIGVYRKNSTSSNGHTGSTSTSPDKAASTIQSQYRKYQQKKQKEVN